VSSVRMAKFRSDGKAKNGERERSIAVGAPALQLSTAPRPFLPNSVRAVTSAGPECAAIATVRGEREMSKWQERTRKDIS
jgi:hypothetical protein